MNPKYPLYVVSYKRSHKCLTHEALERANVPHYIVTEEDDYDNYVEAFGEENILVTPDKYHKEYDACDNLGDTKSKGPGVARNFVWDHSIENGFPWHWVMDDNIRDFYRLNNNRYYRCGDGTIFLCMEDFCERYENVSMAGPDYQFFTPQKAKLPPFIKNTRIYSCNLIRNDVPLRWRGRYNEDTDLSLCMLKSGWCTIQFYAFLQDKVATQTITGGNTANFYSGEGTLPKSRMQVKLHPDVSRLVWKFNRWHHHVDYGKFKKNKLIRKEDVEIKDETNNYGMELKVRK